MGADGERMARVHLRHLVDRDVVGDLVHAGAAELLGPWHAEQAELAHRLDVVPGKSGSLIELARDRRDMVAGKLAHHFADLMVLLGEVEKVVHG